MKVNFFKLNKNRKFNYTPRFTKVKMMLRQLLNQSFLFTESHITQTILESIGLTKGIKCVIEKIGVLI